VEHHSRNDRASLLAALAASVGTGHLSTEEKTRRFFCHDIARAGRTAACVISPASLDELARVVRTITASGYAVVPRGGGASYTGGYLPETEEAVLVDMRRIDRVLEVNTADMYVTVGCGATWQSLIGALAAHGVRTPVWGPLSGSVATIGGSLSQHAILWGSVRHGSSADSVLGLDVVLADGQVLRTGAGAVRGARPFFRHYGPDLTGLFLGDCGALGIKAHATLRLVRVPDVVETASFGFDTHMTMAAAMSDLAREGIVTECFGMDAALQRQRMKRAGLGQDLKALKGVVTSAGGLAAGVRDAARVARAGRRFLDDVPYSVHVGTEGRDDASVAEALRAIRQVAADNGGREVENTIPRVLRGSPYVAMTSAIGPEGERWLPVHGVVPLSDAAPAWSAVTDLLARYRQEIERLDIVVGVLTAVVGASAFVIEPVFYWPAPRTPFYEGMLDEATLAKFVHFPPNPDAEALVFHLRDELTALFLSRGATHLQIGRTYPYREGLSPATFALLEAVKAAVDPRGLMNPGVLGLGAPRGEA
jgi:FAD/FMN-containing dehydrogenase